MTSVMICIVLNVVAPAADADPGWLRIVRDDTVITIRPDGSRRTEREQTPDPLERRLSPDHKASAYIQDGALFIADANGQNAKQVAPQIARAADLCWFGDSKQILYTSKVGEERQIFVAQLDGKVRQLTSNLENIQKPRCGLDGKVSYVIPRKGEPRKFEPVDLFVIDQQKVSRLVEDEYISDYEWSPDGRTIAYGTLDEFKFLDVATGKTQVLPLGRLHKKLSHHCAIQIVWKPDSGAVACRLLAYGGRPMRLVDDPEIREFGDDEVFVITRDGKLTTLTIGEGRGEIEWLR